jgi:hypothetical protein
MGTELMNLSWNEFQNSAIKTFKNLQADTNFTDVTLACGDGQQMKAHKVILSASSPFFRDILIQNPHQHPLLYLKGVDREDLGSLLKFIYSGEVEIPNEGLGKFLEAANELKVDGLLQKRANGEPQDKKRQYSFNEDDRKDGGNIMEEIESKIQNMARLANNSVVSKDVKAEFLEASVLVEDAEDNIREEDLVSNLEAPEEYVAEMENNDEEEEDEMEGEDPPTDPYQDDIKFDEVIEDTSGGLLGYKQTEINTLVTSFECEFCPNAFASKQQLNIHIDEEHDIKKEKTDGDEEPWNQPLDNKTTTTCNICYKEFTTSYSLKEHKEAIHENIKFLCDYCDHISSSKRNLRGHIGKRHPGKDLPVTYTKIKSDNVPDSKPEKTPKKSMSTAKTPKKTKKSISTTNMNSPSQNSKPVESDNNLAELEEKLDAITEKREEGWVCLECGKISKGKAQIRRHSEIHLSGFSHQCPTCSKTFNARVNLRNHILLQHKGSENATKLPCDQCDKHSPSPAALRIHKYRNHRDL